MLERIVYISAAREPQDQASVDRILQVSQARNSAEDVTGLLIGGGNWWMQVIEGDTEGLEPVWQSIRNDPRHSPVIMVQRREIALRGFAGWSLQFRKAGDAEFTSLVDELTGGVTDPRLREQMRTFSETFLAGGRDWDGVAA